MKYIISIMLFISLCSCSEYEKDFKATNSKITGDNVCKPPDGFNSFYSKYLNANGIPILGSENVQDEALKRVRHTIINMLAKRPDVLCQMIMNNARVAIVADEEETSDLPEYADVDDKEYFNKRGRGYGGTLEEPLATVGEENVMRVGTNPSSDISSRPDYWNGYDVIVHEFSHSIHLVGLRRTDKDFQDKLLRLYQKAKSNPMWMDQYALTNEEEYFAEASQRWFNAVEDLSNLEGLKQAIYTREQLKIHDREMYDLLKTIYNDNNWKPLPF